MQTRSSHPARGLRRCPDISINFSNIEGKRSRISVLTSNSTMGISMSWRYRKGFSKRRQSVNAATNAPALRFETNSSSGPSAADDSLPILFGLVAPGRQAVSIFSGSLPIRDFGLSTTTSHFSMNSCLDIPCRHLPTRQSKLCRRRYEARRSGVSVVGIFQSSEIAVGQSAICSRPRWSIVRARVWNAATAILSLVPSVT